MDKTTKYVSICELADTGPWFLHSTQILLPHESKVKPQITSGLGVLQWACMHRVDTVLQL